MKNTTLEALIRYFDATEVKSIVRIVCVVTLLIAFVGCSNVTDVEYQIETDSNESKTGIVIGEKIPLAHTLENMKKAQASLKDRGVRTTEEELEATHLYICLKPTSEEEYNALVFDTDLEIFEFPLDREIIGEGTVVKNPLGSTNGINWVYTVVEVGKALPNIEYEILEEAYIIEDEEGTRAMNNYEALETESHVITGLLTREEATTRGRWRPSATIKVRDDVKNRLRPVQEVQIRFRSGIRFYTGWTDGNGYRSSAKRILGRCNFSLKFEYHDNKWDLRDNRTGQAFYWGPNQKSDWIPNLDNGREAFYCKVYIFAREYYKKYNNLIVRKSIRAYDKNGDDGWNKLGTSFGDNWTCVYRNKSDGRIRSTADLFVSTIGAMGALQYWNKNEESSTQLRDLFCYAIAYDINKKYGYPDSYDYCSSHQRDGNLYKSLFIDLIDRTNQRYLNSSYPVDRVSGYTYGEIFNSSTFKIKDKFVNPNWQLTHAEIKQKLYDNLMAYSNPTETKLNELFSQY